MIVIVMCRRCQQEYWIAVPEIGFHAWQYGAMIQEAMPMLSSTDRELLVSQTCGECWKKLFPEQS